MIIIESRLGVRFEYYYIEDGNFGIFNKRTGHWNGIVEDLMHNEADMGVGLAITHERAKVIDFAEPNSKIGLAIIVKINNAEHQEPNDVFKFLLPFDLNAWLCVLGIVHLFIVLIWGTEKALHRNVPFFEIAMYLISIALGRDTGNDMRPQSMTGRWLSTVFSFISLVVVAAYSANLAAYYIVDKTNLPISGILDPKVRESHYTALPISGILDPKVRESHYTTLPISGILDPKVRESHYTTLPISGNLDPRVGESHYTALPISGILDPKVRESHYTTLPILGILDPKVGESHYTTLPISGILDPKVRESHYTTLPISGILDPKLTAPNTGLTYSTTKNSRNEIYFRDHRDPRIAEMYKEIKKHQVKGSVHGVDMVKKGVLRAILLQ
ncbi:predicted protein [Nematostella vectensis]|uniref:Uncharacterized protein n=1 Tax=Nematostella vectensis TaxID=45351 RepID=A7T3J0_NEMVE|nr:predicted protein [Nematostella vectensis]|eukprot:XP_001621573.1 hypothetical protein NEMVEDRAFT_v1g221819 [Nematostella vectensis]